MVNLATAVEVVPALAGKSLLALALVAEVVVALEWKSRVTLPTTEETALPPNSPVPVLKSMHVCMTITSSRLGIKRYGCQSYLWSGGHG